jgi:hypothetical protein
VNLDMVELSAYGPEIVSGPDAGQAFGAGPAALPAGATAAPVGAPAPLPPAAGNVPAYAPPAAPQAPVAAPPVPVAMPSPGAVSPVAASAPPAPYSGFIPPVGSGPAPTAVAPSLPATWHPRPRHLPRLRLDPLLTKRAGIRTSSLSRPVGPTRRCAQTGSCSKRAAT